MLPVENIVPEDERDPVVPDEFLAEDKCLRKPGRLLLLCIGKGEPDLAAVPEKGFVHRQVPGCRDDEDFPDTREHQDRKRVVHQRFVVNREKLFRHRFCDRVEPCAVPSCKDNPLHDASLRKSGSVILPLPAMGDSPPEWLIRDNRLSGA